MVLYQSKLADPTLGKPCRPRQWPFSPGTSILALLTRCKPRALPLYVNAVPTCRDNLHATCNLSAVLTPNATCGRLAERRKPDHDAHKDALPVDIQDPSLAASDLNAPGIGVVPEQSRSFTGRLSPFSPWGHSFKQNTPTQAGPKAAQVGMHGHLVKMSRQLWRECMNDSLYI
jgi:hypothetical protein